ncbi:hypothetical protein [Effusibacillus pohliae]|uniref:hypothetical protein n=1 Tax=Effusibacillus pohliae TaxID=232270 RepID=UPI000362E4A5|nr:hypothetical protein [Effusibacillus pohliae]
MSIAEFYGWTYRPLTAIPQVTAQCSVCGEQMYDQREAVMYECERCMNDRAE